MDYSNTSTSIRSRRSSLRGRLPLTLRALFLCSGFAMALPSTALLYIVNTQVQIPLSLLPVYASIAFLPFSLKPVYALLNDCMIPSPLFSRRSMLLMVLFLLSSAAILATIQVQTIASCIFLAFIRGVVNAWSEFLLWLDVLALVKQEQVPVSQQPQNNEGDHNNHDNHHDPNPSSSSTLSLHATAHALQAQASMYQNLGSLLSYMTASAYFGCMILHDNPTAIAASASDNNSNNNPSSYEYHTLLIMTAGVNIVGAILAATSCWGSSNMPQEGNDDDDAVARTTTSTTTRSSSSNSLDHLLFGMHASCQYQPIADVVVAQQDDDFEPQSYSKIAVENTTKNPISASDSILITTLVVSFQLSIMVAELRSPIREATSTSVCWITWTACILMLCASIGYAIIGSHYTPWMKSASSLIHNSNSFPCFRVGLFLLLRHAVPNAGYFMDSYVYTMLQNHPLVLQLLSIHSSIMSTLASWSYNRFWVQSSSSSKSVTSHQDIDNNVSSLYRFIVITTIVASVMSLTQLLYVYIQSPPYPFVGQLVAIVVVQTLTTVADEWKFLPDLVLATMTAASTTPTATATPTTTQDDPIVWNHDHDYDVVDTQQSERLLPVSSNNNHNDRALGVSSSADEHHDDHNNNNTDLRYGTLLSCIDFGEQLGALLAGPLISILHVTRHDDHDHQHHSSEGGVVVASWQNVDRFIVCTSILSAASLVFLLLLRSPSPGSTRSSM